MIDKYFDFLKSEIKITEPPTTVGWTEIETPFLNPIRDYIAFYYKKDGKNFILSDAGITLNELELLGIDVNSELIQDLIVQIKLCEGVSIDVGVITKKCSFEKLCQQVKEINQKSKQTEK